MTKHKTNSKNIIAFQGMPGAYSEMACQAVLPDWTPLSCLSFDDAFKAVQTGAAERAMIPIDNTLAGRVADVHHLLPDSGLFVIGEYFLPIRHALVGIKGAKISDLTDIHSHQHAIPQCRKLIKELGVNAHIHADTAGAAADIARREDKTQGAIASPLAARINDLQILREDVQDADHNATRFLILSPEKQTPAMDEPYVLTSLVFSVRNIPAALYKALGGFATNGLSHAKLESYIGAGFKVARFYLEVEGHEQSDAFQRAMEELSFFAEDIHVLGCYKADETRLAV